MSRTRGALIVFTVALVAHAAYLAWRGPAVQADGVEYQRFAENLRQYRTFSLDTSPPIGPSIRRAPGFPAFVALANGPNVAICLQVLMSAAVALFVFLLANDIVPVAPSMAAGLAYGFHPQSLYWARMLHSESSFTFFTAAGVWLLATAAKRPTFAKSWPWLAGGGALLGVAALCRPVGAPFILVAATVLALWLGAGRRRQAGLVVLVGLAVIAPWIVRSSRLAHHFVMLSATSTVNLYVGAQSGQPIYSDVWFQRFLREDPCGRGFNTAKTPVESVAADAVCTAGAKAAIAAHPGAYLFGRGRALLRLVTSSFDLTIDNTRSVGELRAQGAWGVLALKAFLFVAFCLLPLALAAIGFRRSLSSPSGALAAALWLYTIAVIVPGYTEFRYFVPAVPGLFVTAAVGVCRSRGWIRRA